MVKDLLLSPLNAHLIRVTKTGIETVSHHHDVRSRRQVKSTRHFHLAGAFMVTFA